MPQPKKPKSLEPPDFTSLRVLMERTRASNATTKPDNERKAQDLVYDAMEASSWEERLELVELALGLDPKNVDALLMVEESLGQSFSERIPILASIVKIAEDRLGKNAFKELAPNFWGFIETRPYMRARERYAALLRAGGRLDEAVVEYKEMLRLNENDNQGIRYSLLPALLKLGHLDEARELLDQFDAERDYSVVFAWCWVLATYLSGDHEAAERQLDAARQQNAHVEAYVKGHRKLPKKMPYTYSPGSPEEAICFADLLIDAWTTHHAAYGWLLTRPKSKKPTA